MFLMNTFSYAIISAIVTIQIKIYWWLEYFVASGCVPIVKTPEGFKPKMETSTQSIEY